MTAQDREMLAILAQLELVSHGQTQAIAPSTGSGGGGGERIVPPGESNPPHVEFRRRYNACRSDDSRRDVIDEARLELRRIRGGADAARRRKPVREETVQERDLRIVQKGEGLTAKEAAVAFRCGERDVAKARIAAGRDPESGREWSALADRMTRARGMRRAGMTVRDIAEQLGVGKSTVDRWTREAA